MSFWLFLSMCLCLLFGLFQPFIIYLGISSLLKMEKEASDDQQ